MELTLSPKKSPCVGAGCRSFGPLSDERLLMAVLLHLFGLRMQNSEFHAEGMAFFKVHGKVSNTLKYPDHYLVPHELEYQCH